MTAIQTIIDAICKLFTWWIFIAPWEQAIRVRAGKHVSMHGRGVILVIPFLDRVYVQSVRRRVCNLPSQVVTSKDGVALSVGVAIAYAITDLRTLYDTLHMADDSIRAFAAAVIADFISSHDASECDAAGLATASSKLDFETYGLGEASIRVINIARVKTYRLITGDMITWSTGPSLDTIAHSNK